MNTAFVVNGALVILAAALLLRPSGQGRLANWQRWLVIGYSLGLFTIASFPEAPVAWMLPLHALGTSVVVLSGNLAVFVTGRLGTHLGMPTWLARAFMTIGAFGFVMFFVVQAFFVVDSPILPPNIGTLERLAVYPLPFVQFVVGTALLVAAARVRRLNLALTR